MKRLGTGFGVTIEYAAPFRFNAEFTYTINYTAPRFLRRKNYTNYPNPRIGIAFGSQYFLYEPCSPTIWSSDPINHGTAVYCKLLFGSSIMWNFISTSSYLKFMWMFARNPDIPDDIDYEPEMTAGFGIGMNLEFWLSPGNCITLGVRLEGDPRSLKRDDEYYMKFDFRPEIGIRTYFSDARRQLGDR